jgi:MFS family permease
MAILQAFAGFLYQVQVVSTFAYLPEMAREVGQERMNNYTAIFEQSQFSSQAIFTIVIVAFSIGFSLDTVHTAMVGQGAVVLWGVVFFSWGWKHLPSRPARHTLHDGQWMLLAGFAQNWKTSKTIWTRYRKGVKWYLLATIFAEASSAAITNISVIVRTHTLGSVLILDLLVLFSCCILVALFVFVGKQYLTDVVGLSVTQIGIFFLIALVSTIPGSKLGSIITHHTNPNTSWKMSQVALLIAMIIGALTLDSLRGPKELCYIWSMAVGVLLGWYYPALSLYVLNLV